MPKFSVSMRDFEGQIISSIFDARGHKSAIREAIKIWIESIKYTGGSRVQFEVRKNEETKSKYFDAYFEWTEDGHLDCYRIERAG